MLDRAPSNRVPGDPLGARGRLAVAVTISLLVAVIVPDQPLAVRAVIAWDTGSVVLLALAWAIILRSDAEATRARASAEDAGRYGVFLIAIFSSLVSLAVAVLVLAHPTMMSATSSPWLTVLSVAAILGSWLLTHTIYALRYAHLYYRDEDDHPGSDGGLVFPGSLAPDDLDFAYFSFTLGMAFQVSDVTVSARRMRRTVLWHALQSYVYNTVILGLALNLLFSTIGK